MVSDQLWMLWSDTSGWGYRHHASTKTLAEGLAARADMRRLYGATDWRPVRIPPPSQIEATADLLAALKLILESVPSEVIGEYESNAAHAAIAKANGEEK